MKNAHLIDKYLSLWLLLASLIHSGTLVSMCFIVVTLVCILTWMKEMETSRAKQH